MIVHDLMLAISSQEPSVNLVAEFLRCELMIKSLGEKQENYSQSIVQVDIPF